MKRNLLERALAVALLAAMMTQALPLNAREALAEKLTRLHVLANSDSEADQALKLLVRDAVLEAAEGAEKPDVALLGKLERAARKALREAGSNEPVRVSFEKCWFERRDYETFSLPEGIYDAVRVEIGSAEGHNWWCVIYPPLCAGVCQKDVEIAAREAGLTEDEIGLIFSDEGYILRFRLAEILRALLQKLQKSKPDVKIQTDKRRIIPKCKYKV
ncbi:MAG: stage II sporulation protein R [Clostridia bacterium]|nr:stage II sporulation protein R [Clostridia bacterium]